VSILNNLIVNAIDAVQPGGKIWVDQQLIAEYMVFRVADDGQGIKPRDIEMIYQPGFSTKIDPATGKFSTGLGLTHVKQLTEEMGGDIQVDSRPGKTIFEIRIPVSEFAALHTEGDDT
jgi:two-component system sensor histidine kinase YcbA